MSYAGDHAGGSYLRAYLSPLDPFLARDDVTDIFVNRPGEVWVESVGAPPVRVDAPELDARTLARLARQIAARADRGVGRHSPLLAAALPDGARVQVVMPPATRGEIAIAIRRQAIRDLTLADCTAAGLFDTVTVGPDGERARADRALKAMLDARDWPAFMATAVSQRRNIVVSGGTSTGKTTFLNVLVGQIAADERLIAIEDTPEIRLPQPNAVGLVAVPGDERGGEVGVDALLRASLRMRPSRIIMGELRGPEAYSFLRAVNTGHPGSITTLHADSPAAAAEQMALMVLQGGTTLRRADVLGYVRATVDVWIQLSCVAGRRFVSAVECPALTG